jgi:hypothetical protein
MDETTRTRRRTFGWPVIVALILLAAVMVYVVMRGGVLP